MFRNDETYHFIQAKVAEKPLEGQPMLSSIFHAISRYRTPKQEIQDVEKQIVPVEEVQENPMLHVPAVQVDPYPSVASTRSSTRVSIWHLLQKMEFGCPISLQEISNPWIFWW